MSENQNIKWEFEPGGDYLWLRFPFSAAYQAPDSPGGSATVPKTILKTIPKTIPKTILKTTQKTTQERILVLLEAIKQRMMQELLTGRGDWFT